MRKRTAILALALSLILGNSVYVPAAEDTGETAAQETAGTEETQAEQTEEAAVSSDTVLLNAQIMYAQYNYDAAIQYLKSQPDFDVNKDYMDLAAKCQVAKGSLVEYPLEQVTHVFFHTLIKDTSKAFDGDSDEAGYNQMMTTIDEFNRIIQILYDKGYVLVSPHDMATVNEDGTMSRGKILLPEGKTPFVLSQDDVSYYHYMDGDGFASRLVLDENGQVKAEYIEDDGTVSVGNYDMVPILDEFISQHPDFSYRGRKGVLAMTGYNGVLGYRTDIAYKTGENLQDNQREFLESHPDFDYEAEVAEATKVAEAMKATGWEFASHTWGHMNATDRSAEDLQTDNEKWEAYVAPILGKTDMIIFAFGADIGGWEGYSMDNPKFAYYKSRGYNYYCNVDSSQYFVQITDEYFRQGRRNLDGYRMYYNPDLLSDLFDVSEVWDSTRPTPVPEM
ncbi:MAG TPA: polysaccharide deacetylase family protein [Candidatus Blautia excrementigallinarum]|nr:polysaccharide deacetylase family protein [Candidatus Blautia excrementigallinarum]